MTTQQTIDAAVSLAVDIANDNSHGYEWGGWGPNYDCGHLIIDVFERAGIPVKSRGACYTGNMPEVFMACGASDVTERVNLVTGAGMVRGDVLVNRENHAALYIGGGQIVQARSNFDGVPGDSSGQEIRVQGYYNYPWTHVLRFTQEEKVPSSTTTTNQRILSIGMSGDDVRELQELLIKAGFDVGSDGADGDFGRNTLEAVIRYQESAHLEADGIAGTLTMVSLRSATSDPKHETTKTENQEDERDGGEIRMAADDETAETTQVPKTYTVKSGDTLWGISERVLGAGGRYQEIMTANGLTSTVIHVGDVLRLPDRTK